MMTIKGDQNKLLGIIPDTLVVAPQNEGIAREILFSKKSTEQPMYIKTPVNC